MRIRMQRAQFISDVWEQLSGARTGDPQIAEKRYHFLPH